MTDLPSGTVTLLFTDIEGSTRLLRSLGDRYAELLVRHRALLRAVFEKWNGTEVDTQGDSFFVAFLRVTDALSAAADGQLALQSQPWPDGAQLRVRMGLHTGEPGLGPTGYVGVDVHRAARISEAAHGGQMLLSAATHEIVAGDLPQGMHTRDLGYYRLKDLDHAEHLYELLLDGLPAEFPPLRAAGLGIANLPVQLTSFVGREHELHELGRLMADPDCHILTLVGPGGIGKSRLAMETATRQVHAFADGAVFIPLAPLRSADHLVPSIARALQFSFDTHSSDLDPKSQLLDYLRDRSILLLMDNFEHLLPAADLLVEFVGTAPGAKVLVTSRERLNLQSEWTFEVQGMAYPVNGNGANLDEYSALQLFQDRARQADPSFELTAEQGRHASRICQLAEGMPLGIELATAWIPVLSCREIADEIARSLDFLASQRKDLPERHRSLRAAFEHSWNLLPPEHQMVFTRLSVFRGGFSRQAAASVADAGIRVLSDLVAKSLVHRDAAGRYETHELLRQYAREKLQAVAGEEERIRQRHAAYFVDYLVQRHPVLLGAGQLQAKLELRTELENLRAALDWSLARWEPDPVLAALRALHHFYWMQGWHEGLLEFGRMVESIQRDRQRPSPADVQDDPVYLCAYMFQAGFLTDLGRHEDSERIMQDVLPAMRRLGLEQALPAAVMTASINAALRGEYRPSIELGAEAEDLARGAGQEEILAVLLLWTGWDHYQLGDYEAANAQWSESYQISQRLQSVWGLAFALSKLGLGADAVQQYQQAMDYHHEAREVFVKQGDTAGEAYTLSRLSMSLYGLNRLEEAVRSGEQGLELFESIGHRWGMTVSLCRIAFPVLRQGDTARARDLFTQALQRALDFNMVGLVLYALGGLGCVLAAEGRYREAAEIFAVYLGHPTTPAIYKQMTQPYVDQTRLHAPDELADPTEPLAADYPLEDFARQTLLARETALAGD